MMNTYVCPICGKTYTSATAMAQCVAECAKREDKTKALKEAGFTPADAEMNAAEQKER